MQGAEDLSFAGEGAGDGGVGLPQWSALLGQPEIEQLDALLREQNVGRLQIAVGDAFAVRGVKRVEDLSGVVHCLGQGQPTFKRRSFQELITR